MKVLKQNQQKSFRNHWFLLYFIHHS